jgi:serine/threonine-protein kinase
MALGDAVPRFEREAVATARVNHPNVTAASDFGRLPDGVLYLVLEHVKGTSLREVLAGGPLALERTLSIVDQMVQGLGAAHALGIIHRGVKPENVILVQRATGELVKLQDFGLAVLAVDDCHEDALTRIGTTPGTPEYMAPEQATGHWIDTRSDLYAVGVVLYECLAGRVPFAAEDAVQVLGMHLQEPPPPLPPCVPEPVALLVRDLLAKDPERRIQSASECALRIESVRAGLVTHEAPAPAPEAPDDVPKIALPLRKSRAGLVVAICALTLLSGGVSALIGRYSNEEPPLLAASLPSVGERARAVRLVSSSTPSSGAEPTSIALKQHSQKSPARPKASRGTHAQPARARSKAPPRKRDTRRQAAPARRTGPFGIYVPPPKQWF